MDSIRQLMEVARKAALQAGREIMQVYKTADFETVIKADDSPLTRADKLAHSAITTWLARTGLPVLSEEGATIEYATRSRWQWFWMVDPLDGTKEFIKQLNEFTVNIALIHLQKPVGGVVYIPTSEILYEGDPESGVHKLQDGKRIAIAPASSHKDLSMLMSQTGVVIMTSRSHQSDATRQFIGRFSDPVIKAAGSSLKFLELIEDRADIYPRLEPSMEWDTAAAHALLRLTNRGIYQMDMSGELLYNKADLINPSFIAL